jgi:hypothetical protein
MTTLIGGEAIPFPVSQGGTGAATLTGLLVGAGTGAITAIGSTTAAATSFSPSISWATAGSSSWGTIGGSGRYSIIGNICFFSAQVTWGTYSAGSGASGALQLSLPVAAGAYTVAGQGFYGGVGLYTPPATAYYYVLNIGSGATNANLYVMDTITTSSVAFTEITFANITAASNGSVNYSGHYFIS